MLRKSSLITLLFLPLLAAAQIPDIPKTKEAPTPAETGNPAADHPEKLRELIDKLNQANLQEAFRLLKSDYINREDLDHLEINRAALQGLLDRLDFGAMLLTEKSRSAKNSPFKFHQARITDSVGYLRFGKYNQAGLKDLDEALEKFSADEKIETLIMDLRSPQAQADFAIASEILSRFRPPNDLLFKIRRPGNERATLFVSKPKDANWRREVILLVDSETGNVGEMIAAVLKRETDCLIIGEKTPGLTVEFRDVPVGDDRILRYAIADVLLEDETSLFQKGVEPDIVTTTPQKTKHAIFKEIDQGKSLTDYLFLKQRPRLNEAALVAGTDPELDYYLLRSARKPTPWDKPSLEDRVLRQAVDLLNATSFLKEEEKTIVGRK